MDNVRWLFKFFYCFNYVFVKEDYLIGIVFEKFFIFIMEDCFVLKEVFII